jgi:hypothetical protein
LGNLSSLSLVSIKWKWSYGLADTVVEQEKAFWESLGDFVVEFVRG